MSKWSEKFEGRTLPKTKFHDTDFQVVESAEDSYSNAVRLANSGAKQLTEGEAMTEVRKLIREGKLEPVARACGNFQR